MLKVEVYKEKYLSNNSKKPLRRGFHALMDWCKHASVFVTPSDCSLEIAF